MAYHVRMSYEKQPFSEYLRSALEESGVTPSALAAHFGISPQAVSQWLSGNTMPRSYRIDQVRAYFADKIGNGPQTAKNPSYERTLEIGPKLQKLYRSGGVDHNHVAREIGVDPLYLEEIEQGRATPSWPVVCKLSDYFQVGTDFFRGGTVNFLDVSSQIGNSLEKRAWFRLWEAMTPAQREVAVQLIRDGLIGNTTAKRA